MTAINHTDLLFVTALSGGVTLLSTSMRGVSSIGDVFRYIRSLTVAARGVITLHIRNSSQGWAQQHNIVLRGMSEKTMAAQPAVAKVTDSYPSLFPDGII